MGTGAPSPSWVSLLALVYDYLMLMYPGGGVSSNQSVWLLGWMATS